MKGFLSYEDIDDTGCIPVPQLCEECGSYDCVCDDIFTTYPDIKVEDTE